MSTATPSNHAAGDNHIANTRQWQSRQAAAPAQPAGPPSGQRPLTSSGRPAGLAPPPVCPVPRGPVNFPVVHLQRKHAWHLYFPAAAEVRIQPAGALSHSSSCRTTALQQHGALGGPHSMQRRGFTTCLGFLRRRLCRCIWRRRLYSVRRPLQPVQRIRHSSLRGLNRSVSEELSCQSQPIR